jgi:xanthine dehydrogenase accessory factor
MGFDRAGLQAAVAAYGRVARVVIADVKGSSPREVGAAMLVWDGGQSGTIGGGVLEYELARAARGAQSDRLSSHALGPDLGQCCGGAVRVLTEIYDGARVAALPSDIVARGTGARPLAVTRLLSKARGQGQRPEPQLVEGWFVEPVHKPARDVWIWGAGHVGRAIVDVLAPIPDIAITWVDTGEDRFPDAIPGAVTPVPVTRPALLVAHAPLRAEHLILTYSHVLDFELCHKLLGRGFGFAGLIGSKTKWVRFRKRLAALGHTPDQIARITCPIGDPSLGKHPQMIAIGVALAMLKRQTETSLLEEKIA